METGYPPNRGATLNRGKTLSRPERYQPASPLLTTKESSSWDPWVVFSRVITFWAPGSLLSSLGGLRDKGSQQAWREKIALCFIAVVMGGIVAFLTVGFTTVLCPPSAANNPTKFIRYNSTDDRNGQDITNRFTRDTTGIGSCRGGDIQQFTAVTLQLCQNKTICNAGPLLQQQFDMYNIVNTTKRVGYDWKQLASDALKNYLVIDGNVLNLDPYLAAVTQPLPNDKVDVVIRTVLGTDHKEGGKDATRLFFGRQELKASVNCLVQKYFAGNIDKETIGCFTSQLFLYVSLTVILSIVMVRFFMACVFDWFISHRLALEPKKSTKAVVSPQVVVGGDGGGARAAPWAHRNESGAIVKTVSMDEVGNDLFTVLLVTCYSEGEEGLRCTCESMAATEYPDDRKLIFLVCDGIITGHGNDKSTPDIAVDLLELLPEFKDPQPQSYVAVAAGSKQHNKAKVYAGYFPYQGRKIPVVCVVKCGAEEEQGKGKPGNRGKRDSQLILMNFFSRVTYNDRMTPLDYDLFRKIHRLMGVTPDFFEICLMVDADTKVYPDSLRLLINCMCNDPLIMGLCGETKIANKKDSFTTAIQVFEYYISHHLGKGFESVFGGVTCLPGCFCMYRLKARKGDDDWVPIITKPEIVQEYSQNTVDTLHQKNLLLLGEDRFLTTLMLRNFPHRKMMFCPQAVCKTVVPDEFKVLLSQRRRWINSTIHNLMELVLVRNLCGTFCFSMQFVIFMELIGTVVLPVAIMLTYSLIINTILSPPKDFSGAIPLLMLGMVLGLPAILILITTRKIVYIAWMLIYLMALPIWNFVLPTYAYWHFDDFSWGETRKVEGEAKGDDHGKKDGTFDAAKVQFKRWEDWERSRLRKAKRDERQRANQQMAPAHLTHAALSGEDDANAGLISSNQGYDNNYYAETSSINSAVSQDIGPPQQYYDYSAGGAAPGAPIPSGYPPQNQYQTRPPQDQYGGQYGGGQQGHYQGGNY
ncbi:9988_t:CDS:2 [Ambispora gerdemannii]|uniref:chitin synthase n=1 Tax=Ambispora gerdemannii TaxID=144530 RepID=A0A9N8V5P7_9GLOM|nr:9988_t:CDS:2 [Ambispora gerdemannii]